MNRSRSRRRRRHGGRRPELTPAAGPQAPNEAIAGAEGVGEASVLATDGTAARAPAPPNPMITLEDRTVRQFPRIALARGREYFNAGRVSEPTWTGTECGVSIRGTGGDYKVNFDFSHVADARRLPGRCDCPAYERGLLCKHLWAAILQIDKALAAGAAGTVPASGSLKVIHGQPRARREGRRGAQPSGAPQPIQHGHPTSWVYRLNELQGQTAASSRVISTNLSASFVIVASETQSTGKLVVDLWTRHRSPRGDLGPLRPNRISGRDFAQFHDPRDQEVLSLLTRGGSGRSPGNVATRFVLDSILESHLIPMLADAGKLFLSRSPTGTPDSAERPLRMDRGRAWDLELKLEPVGTEQYRLEGRLRRDTEGRSLADPIAILKSGFLLWEERIGRFSEPRHAAWAFALRFPPEFLVPRTDGDAFLTRLLLDPASPKLTWPESMGWTRETIEPKPKGVFRPLGNDPSTGRMTLTVSFDYAGRDVPLSETEMTFVDVAEKKVYVRNQEFEEATLRRALEILRDTQGTGAVPISDLHRAATELSLAGWTIYIENQRVRVAEDFAMNVRSSTDWFDLNLEADFGGTEVTREQLMAALESKSGLVKLSDGSLGMLPQDFIQRYASITEFGQKTDEGALRFSRSQGLMLSSVLTDTEHFKADKAFQTFQEKVRKFEGIKTAKAPAGFTGKLRNYQKEGLTWLRFLQEFETGGILADDMGLGKTIQILAYIRGRVDEAGADKLPSLVVAPKSLIFNWMDEASRFVPGLKIVRYAGAGRNERIEDLKGADLVVTTYGTLRSDIEQLKEFEFDTAIVDEAQAIKNPKSLAAMACKRLRARQKLALTGTPIENSINDLLSILEFTNPGLLNISQSKELSKDSQGVLARMLKPFLLRRTKEKVLTELPDKSEQVIFCEMSTAERQFYTAIREHYRASIAEKIEKSGLGRSKLHVLEALLRLRQAACHFGLVDPEKANEPSAKLALLLNHIQEVTQEGHKALVFSQFTSLLALVRKQLDENGICYEYLDGQTEDRKTPVERFQSDAGCPVFLISLKAGGTGLNLTAADYVFILDPWWNPAVEAQAIGRAHRLGQTSKVFAYRMIARGTVEEKILELQQTKRDLAESIISEDKDFMKKLTKEDLAMLLD